VDQKEKKKKNPVENRRKAAMTEAKKAVDQKAKRPAVEAKESVN